MRHGCGVALLISAAVMMLAAWFLGLGTYRMMTLPRPFSSTRWKEAARGVQDGTNIDRCRMVLDLRVRVGLTGRSAADVIALLGEDDRFHSGGIPRTYLLCASMGDYYVLHLAWRKGRVVSTRVHDE